MFALLIKPAAMNKAVHRELISELKANGAIQLQSHNVSDLRAEIKNLKNSYSDLTVVACGGDGTVNLAVNALVGLQVKFAVVPMGTGNDFARHLGISKLEIAKSALKGNRLIDADLGSVQLANGEIKHFAVVASCGFDAQVNERANRISGPNGPAKYLLSVFGEIKNLAPIKVSLEMNDTVDHGKYTLIAIGNTSSYGGGMKITPSADLVDGKFAVTLVAEVPRRTLIRVLPKVFSGKHVFHPKVAVSETTEIEITGSQFIIYADGERLGFGPAKFEVKPALIQILMP